MDDLLGASDRLRDRLGDGAAVVLGARTDGRAMLVANFAKGAVKAGLSADALIKGVAPLVDGGGGGRPSLARAGGKRPEGLPEALSAARELIRGQAG